MDKHKYIIKWFNDIKDEISFDHDVVALGTLLQKLLEIDIEESFFKWQYLIIKYDIGKLSLDIDFSPLIHDYPDALLKKVGLESFFQLMSNLPLDKAQLIYQVLFNVYEGNSFLYQSLDYCIKKEKYQEEKKLIYTFLKKKKDFFKGVFEEADFIRTVISMHLENKKDLPLSFLQELIQLVDSKKEQAVLNTLIIDYI